MFMKEIRKMLNHDKEPVNINYDMNNPKFKKAMKQVGISKAELQLIPYAQFI